MPNMQSSLRNRIEHRYTPGFHGIPVRYVVDGPRIRVRLILLQYVSS